MAPVLVYDGGCIFCKAFAQLAELKGGIPDLDIVDGRADHQLRSELTAKGAPLRNGAVVMDEGRVLHGAEAIQWICERMEPSDALLSVLAPLMAEEKRAGFFYPFLLTARRVALAARGLPVDPDAAG